MGQISIQPNGVEEELRPEIREFAEKYYAENGVGSTAEERYRHFREHKMLGPAFYYNLNFYRETHEKDIQRLSTLEWAAWQWDGSI